MTTDEARARLRRSRFRGKAGEMIANDDAIMRMEESHRTGTGSDYLRIRRDPFTNKVVGWNLEEDKTGKAVLSARQKETRKAVGDKHYVVKRIDRPHLDIVAGGLEMADNLAKNLGLGIKKKRKN